MKKVLLSIMVILAIAITSCKNETKEKTEAAIPEGVELSVVHFGVRGNCGMCKATIEKAVKSLEGIATADWDVNKKKIKVSYNEHVVKENDMHKAIAAAGYDTEKLNGNSDSYKKLPECCKFDHDQAMNQ